jgi:hypothetical protein
MKESLMLLFHRQARRIEVSHGVGKTTERREKGVMIDWLADLRSWRSQIFPDHFQVREIPELV